MQEAALIKIFNHYFQRRVLVQAALDFTLIVGVLIFSLMLHKEAGVSDKSALFLDSGRGLLIGLGIVLVNLMLGLYEGLGKMTLGQIRTRAVLSFLFSLVIIYSVLSGLSLGFSVQNDRAMVGLMAFVGSMMVFRVVGLNILPIKFIH